MRKNKLWLFGLVAALCVLNSCTKDFDDINTNTQGFLTDEVSAKFFLTSSQVGLYAPNRFTYWRAHLIHSDRFAGHFTFGHNSSWWSDGLSYNFNASYTDATYGWLAGYFGNIKSFADLTTEGGEFENQYMYAMSLVMKGLYYQMYTDTFGMVPFTEAGVDGILTPAYDTQSTIYKGIIADLDEAMSIIGDTERTGLGVDDAGSNDIYCGGDLQQWKRLANTLKLRIGMRALGAPGDDFAAATITSAMGAPLLDASSGSVTMIKDFEISKWSSSAYGDVWHDFGGGSDWTVSSTLVNLLKDNNDPRLTSYVQPAKGGSFEFDSAASDPPDPNFQDRLDFIVANLDAAGANYTMSTVGTVTAIEVGSGQFIGQPVRVNGDTYPFMRYDMFSTPSDDVITPRGEQVDGYPEIILSSAEAYFLQAEAVVRGLGTGDAQALMNSGIEEAMKLWGIGGGDAAAYAAQPIADITGGTEDERLEKIALQRWLASYTDGFEAWAVVRKTGYPAELAAGVTDPILFALGELNGDYPQRLRYGSGAQENPNYATAVSAQGPDEQRTVLWFAQ
ncbi:SusD/RagB family nutrient-binding outer membrane lipoprotein [Flagellimonas algicola]|uniref:SusD/RagB family nutrient-binding outer membrane lipoprotein n=1 Tax=Flagellimonas algicola TaxID=2583815 RepID=A0ABY2WII4_9FLAO|nr:SusD/RagB family nutrient-binding outer membrane lipoprotein [Allomuricauda algicola]TMU54658.1 SusD/RagB family nutrient-binding outer membrane lipoprotein [Allomuricauda algicola]